MPLLAVLISCAAADSFLPSSMLRSTAATGSVSLPAAARYSAGDHCSAALGLSGLLPGRGDRLLLELVRGWKVKSSSAAGQMCGVIRGELLYHTVCHRGASSTGVVCLAQPCHRCCWKRAGGHASHRTAPFDTTACVEALMQAQTSAAPYANLASTYGSRSAAMCRQIPMVLLSPGLALLPGAAGSSYTRGTTW